MHYEVRTNRDSEDKDGLQYDLGTEGVRMNKRKAKKKMNCNMNLGLDHINTTIMIRFVEQ